MPSLRSGLTIRASEPKHSERTNPLSEQLLDNSIAGEQSNRETITTQPEEGNKSLTGDTGVEQDDAKTPGKQGEFNLTVAESATELSRSTSSRGAYMTVEARRNSQQSNPISDNPTDISIESDFISLGKSNDKATLNTDCEIGIFLNKSLVGDITPAAASTSYDTLFGDGSQAQPDADHSLLVPDCYAESGDKSACDLASNQPPLSTGVQTTKPGSDSSIPEEMSPEMTGKDIDSAIIIVDEKAKQMANPDSAIAIVEDKQTSKPRRTSRDTAKRSFEDFVRSDGLWMGRTLSELDNGLKLTDDLLKSSERVIKKAKIIQKQLIDSQKFIRKCGGKEEKVTRRLEKL